jgi:hypothetical protein
MEAPVAPAPAEVLPSVETPPAHHDDPNNKPALTPPTSEDLDKRDERMSSELSELDSDDGEDIEPDHYWDGGKIPVFKPVRCTLPRRCSAVQGSMRSRPGLHVHAQIQGCVLTTRCCRQWISFATFKGSLTRSTSTA